MSALLLLAAIGGACVTAAKMPPCACTPRDLTPMYPWFESRRTTSSVSTTRASSDNVYRGDTVNVYEDGDSGYETPAPEPTIIPRYSAEADSVSEQEPALYWKPVTENAPVEQEPTYSMVPVEQNEYAWTPTGPANIERNVLARSL